MGDNHTDSIVYYYCFHLQLGVLDHLLRSSEAMPMMFGYSKTPHGDSNLLSREPLVAFGAQHVLALTPTASISVLFFWFVTLFPFFFLSL